MPFNKHTHQWGENSKGCFCLTCGEFVEKDEKRDEGMHSMDYHPTLIWPKKEHKLDDEEVKMGDHFGIDY